jgi:hypothetical protein
MFQKATTVAAVSAAIILGSMLTNAGAVVKSGPSGYANGDCKNGFETVMGSSSQHAQALWTQTVAAKFGTKWAHWVGAKNKTMTPINSGGQIVYQAKGKPCFYQPVL